MGDHRSDSADSRGASGRPRRRNGATRGRDRHRRRWSTGRSTAWLGWRVPLELRPRRPPSRPRPGRPGGERDPARPPRSGGDPDREAEAGRGNGDDGQGGQGGAHAAPDPPPVARLMPHDAARDRPGRRHGAGPVAGRQDLAACRRSTSPPARWRTPSLAGDRVIVSKLTPGPFDLKRGDIVVFKDPGGWLDPATPAERSAVGAALHDALTFVGLLPNDADDHLIKRVIGLPGDHVVCCDGQGARSRSTASRSTSPTSSPATRRATEGLRHHRARRAGLGHGRPPVRLLRLPVPRPVGGTGKDGSVPIASSSAGRSAWSGRCPTELAGRAAATFAKVPAAQSSGKPAAQVK